MSNAKSSFPFITQNAEIPWWRTELRAEERETILDSLAHERISQGMVTAEMEAEICRLMDVPHAVVTTSGSVALLMACWAFDIGPGDEVIVPTRTFIATAHAPQLLGAKVVLVDCRADLPVIDVDAVAAKITSRTKAIMPVHLNGRSCDMEALYALARKHNLRIIEDAAQATFSKNKFGYMGCASDAGCFSFGMVKLINTGQGGAVVTRDKETYERLKAIRNHGVRDVISHDYLQSGLNFKFTDILASIGLWQIRRGPEKAAHCNTIHKVWEEGVKDLPFLKLVPVDIDNGECAVWVEAMCENRDHLMTWLAERGVQSRKFLPCLHTAPHFATSERFPNSERFSAQGFNLTSGPAQTMENVQRAIEILRQYPG